MKILSEESGFTLVEVLVSLSLISIVLVAYLGLFTNSFQGIYSSGYKGEALFETQQDMEQQIINKAVKTPPDELIVNFTNGSFTDNKIKIPGNEIIMKRKYTDGFGNDNASVSLSVFVPDK
ncbi:prepilin-type N-terminal cleavage/methylation domain-containing protein [Heliorestis acidaminivorans]|uniref:Prepilin-type N-terminal cleavage/methylation domain-containing protein n=1 Tax=Heliorestis acidaminivorans TaxID=553427 RepID=A0A6I0F3B6_9FIRM|nr:prepilin-type N-terminal cleavage/methylation domain-containing protein [Heliorestis acidaminivorans]KAB2951650.1 prepilin-type N-terminal cleavage/methylation domain-containing protein [Heliorestis acidaminivorans]